MTFQSQCDHNWSQESNTKDTKVNAERYDSISSATLKQSHNYVHVCTVHVHACSQNGNIIIHVLYMYSIHVRVHVQYMYSFYNIIHVGFHTVHCIAITCIFPCVPSPNTWRGIRYLALFKLSSLIHSKLDTTVANSYSLASRGANRNTMDIHSLGRRVPARGVILRHSLVGPFNCHANL